MLLVGPEAASDLCHWGCRQRSSIVKHAETTEPEDGSGRSDYQTFNQLASMRAGGLLSTPSSTHEAMEAISEGTSRGDEADVGDDDQHNSTQESRPAPDNGRQASTPDGSAAMSDSPHQAGDGAEMAASDMGSSDEDGGRASAADGDYISESHAHQNGRQMGKVALADTSGSSGKGTLSV